MQDAERKVCADVSGFGTVEKHSGRAREIRLRGEERLFPEAVERSRREVALVKRLLQDGQAIDLQERRMAAPE
jgi:hypothetical protein